MAEQEHRGVDIAIYVPVSDGAGGEIMTKVAARRGLELEESLESIDAGHADSYPAVNRIAGMTDWNASVDGVFLVDDGTGSMNASQRAIQQAIRNRRVISIEIHYADSIEGAPVDEATAIMNSFTLSGDYDGVATYSASMEAATGLQQQA